MRKALGFTLLLAVLAVAGAAIDVSTASEAVWQPGDEDIILSDMPLTFSAGFQ